MIPGVDVGFSLDLGRGGDRCWAGAGRQGALDPDGAGEGRPLRRLVLHCRRHDRDLLQAELPGRAAETGEHAVLSQRRCGAGGRIPRLQAVPARRQPGIAGMERACRPGGARDAADRRRGDRPRRGARARRPAWLQRPAGGAAAARRAGCRAAGASQGAAGADRPAADRDQRAAHGRHRVRGGLRQHPGIQRHRARGVRALPHRAAPPRGPRAIGRGGGLAVAAAAVPGAAVPRQPVRAPGSDGRTRGRGVAGRGLPAHAPAAARAGHRRAAPRPGVRRVPAGSDRPARSSDRDQPVPAAARPGRRPGRHGSRAARGPGARAAGAEGTGPPRAAHGGSRRVRGAGSPRPAGLDRGRAHPCGAAGARARRARRRLRWRAHPPVPQHDRAGRGRPGHARRSADPAGDVRGADQRAGQRRDRPRPGQRLAAGPCRAERAARPWPVECGDDRHARSRRSGRVHRRGSRRPRRGADARPAGYARCADQAFGRMAAVARVRGAVSLGDR